MHHLFMWSKPTNPAYLLPHMFIHCHGYCSLRTNVLSAFQAVDTQASRFTVGGGDGQDLRWVIRILWNQHGRGVSGVWCICAVQLWHEDVHSAPGQPFLLLRGPSEWMPSEHLRKLPFSEARQSLFAPFMVSSSAEAPSAPSGKATLFLHRPHRDGDQFIPETKADPERHLQVHNGQLSVLQGEQAGVAEFD